ncbi:hypothetical protein PNA2_1815 [Pyrococcus sp. NA2]|nr:hypothetical protein PNA2_1815 [Pyrococcus sp. NA2]
MNLYDAPFSYEVYLDRTYQHFLFFFSVSLLVEEFPKLNPFAFLFHSYAMREEPEFSRTDEEVVYFYPPDYELFKWILLQKGGLLVLPRMLKFIIVFIFNNKKSRKS